MESFSQKRGKVFLYIINQVLPGSIAKEVGCEGVSKFAFLLIFLICLSQIAFAVPTITVVQPNGDQYLRATAAIEVQVSGDVDKNLDLSLGYSLPADNNYINISTDFNLLDTANCPNYSGDPSQQFSCTTSWDTTAAADGDYFLNAKVDAAGASASDSSNTSFTVDNTKPGTVASGFDTDYNIEDQNVSLACTDSGSGCAATEYRINGGSWNAYSDAGALVSSDGNNVFDYRSTDLAGNTEDAKTVYVPIDKSGPAISVLRPTDNNRVNTKLVEFDVNDQGTDVNTASIKVKINGTDSNVFVPATHCTGAGKSMHCSYTENNYIISGDGSYTLAITAADAFAWTGNASITFAYDTTQPLLSSARYISASLIRLVFSEEIKGGNASDFNIAEPGVTVSGFEIHGSDRKTADLSIQNGKPTSQTTVSTNSTSITDLAGNALADLDANIVQADATAPTTSVSPSSSAWYTSAFTITLACSDSGACDKTYYCVSSSDGCSPSTEYTAGISHSSEGTNYIRYYSTDLAGNAEAAKSQVLKLDGTPPSAPTLSDPGTGDSRIELDWSASSDSHSGMKQYQVYVYDGSSLVKTEIVECDSGGEPSNVTVTGLENGRGYTFKVKAMDNAGNMSSESNSEDATPSAGGSGGGSGGGGTGDSSAPNIEWKEKPGNNSTVFGRVFLKIDAWDNESSIDFVRISLDNTRLETIYDTNAGYYTHYWDTTSVADGSYELKAFAKNGSGLTKSADTINVTVDNANAPETLGLSGEQLDAKSRIDEASNAQTNAENLEADLKEKNIGLSEAFVEARNQAESDLRAARNASRDENYAGAIVLADKAIAGFNSLNSLISVSDYGEQSYEFEQENSAVLFSGVGLENNFASAASQMAADLNVERKLKAVEVVEGENTLYQMNIVIALANNGDERRELQVIEVVPKELAQDAELLQSSRYFEVIEADPIIKWVASVEAGKSIEIVYGLKERCSKEEADAMLSASTMQKFATPPIVLAASEPIDRESFSSALGTPTGLFALTDLSTALLWIGAIIVIVVVVVLAYFAYGKLSAEKEPEVPGLHNVFTEKRKIFRLNEKLRAIGRKKDEEKRPKWSYKG